MQIGKITELTITAMTNDGEPVVFDFSGGFKDAELNVSRNTEHVNGIVLRNINNRVELMVPKFSGTISMNMGNKQRGLFRRLAHGSEV